MNADEIRAKFWKIKNRLNDPRHPITPTLDREIALAQLEMTVEGVAQLAKLNEGFAYLHQLNIPKLALQIDELLALKEKRKERA
jgi:hypothetical protein